MEKDEAVKRTNNDYQIFDVSTDFETMSSQQSVKKFDESGKSRSRCDWKRWILAVSMIVLILVASVFAAFFAINILSPKMLIFRKERNLDLSDVNVREEAVVSDRENYATYEITNPNNTQSKVIIDSNREMLIYKTTLANTLVCLISPLFVVQGNPGVDDSGNHGIGGNHRNGGYHGNYSLPSNVTTSEQRVDKLVKSSRPIHDKNVLGEKGKKLCEGIDVFWAQRIEGKHVDSPPVQPSDASFNSPIKTGDPSTADSTTVAQVRNPVVDPPPPRTSPHAPDDPPPSRRKRQAPSRSYYACYFDFFNCYFISFPDDYFNAQYFTCEIVCAWYQY